MHRTQIYLDDDILKFLEQEKRRTHLSYSQIIRDNIKQNIMKKKSKIIDRMEKASGAWKDRNRDPEEIVEDLRKDRKS